jgi:iron-sulfur cluster assembly protein
VSEKAAGQFVSFAAEQGSAGAMLRIWVAGLGCSGFRYGMGLEEKSPEEGDQVFESNGVRLVIDTQSLGYMDGSTVTWVDDAENSGFSVDNPNPAPERECNCASGTCGAPAAEGKGSDGCC